MVTSNYKQIQKNFEKHAKIVAKNKEEALEEIGQRGVAVAKRQAPVLSGRLKNSQGYSVGNTVNSSGAYESNDSIKPIKDSNTVAIGTNLIYAPSVEYLSKTGSRGFMLRSYNITKGMAKTIMETALKRSTK